MGAPVLMGMGMGAVTSLAMGKDPLMGAALGGVTGGAFGGSEGLFSGFNEGGLFSDNLFSGFDLGGSLAGDVNAVTPSIGSGGYANLNPVNTITPDMVGTNLITPEYNLLTDPTSEAVQQGMYPNYKLYQNEMIQPSIGDPINMGGYTPTADELQTAANLKEYGGLTAPVTEDKSMLDSAYDGLLDMGFTNKDLMQGSMMGAQSLLDRPTEPIDVPDIQGLLPSQYQALMAQSGNQFAPLQIRIPKPRVGR